MKTNILYGGYDIALIDFIKHLKKFNLLAKQIYNDYPTKKIYIPIPVNKNNVAVAIKLNSIQYHPDKLKKINAKLSTDFFNYTYSDNDSIDKYYNEQNNILLNPKIPFIYLLYEIIIDGEKIKNAIQKDTKGNNYITLENLIKIIDEYLAVPITEDKINFISLNDEKITSENNASLVKKKTNAHSKLLAIKYHNTVEL